MDKVQQNYLAKILVIGDGGVGKTSLITRFTDDSFVGSYTATIGVDFKSKCFNYDGKTVKLQIWDTAGQERFRNITQAYYRGAAGILLSFSLADTRSFQNIQKWISQMEQNAPKDCCKVLIGTKSDCIAERSVNRKDAQNLALRLGISYWQCSSKQGININQIFEELGKMIYENSLRKKGKTGQQSLKIKSSIYGSGSPTKCLC